MNMIYGSNVGGRGKQYSRNMWGLGSSAPRDGSGFCPVWFVRDAGPGATESNRGSVFTSDLEASEVEEEPRRKDEMDSSRRAYRFLADVIEDRKGAMGTNLLGMDLGL